MTFATADPRWRCDCGGLLDLDTTSSFDINALRRRQPTMWRYREMIPVCEDENIISFDEGYTPLVPLKCSERSILVKQDHLFPSGSYKDRGASVLISKMKELGITRVVEDSSGNAGAAIAAYCAKAGIVCDIYVPESCSAEKLKQITAYGARLVQIPGSRADTAAAALAAAEEAYYASHTWNPFFFHGTKTFAYEVCEQLGWTAPDTLIVPVGNGTMLLGAYIGFTELHGAGLIDRLPRLIGVQANECAPLSAAFAAGTDDVPGIEPGKTRAEGIAIAAPIRGRQILAAVRSSGGMIVSVSENEILAAATAMGRQGHFIEPTAAATIAGARDLICELPAGETIVTVFTGHGLK